MSVGVCVCVCSHLVMRKDRVTMESKEAITCQQFNKNGTTLGLTNEIHPLSRHLVTSVTSALAGLGMLH